MAWAMVAVGVGVLGVGAGVYTSSEQSRLAAKAQPNLAASSREVSDTQARLLPMQRQLEAAAQQGGKVTIKNFPAHQETKEAYQVDTNYWKSNLRDPLSRGAIENLKFLPLHKIVFSALGLGKTKTKSEYYPASDWEKGGRFEGMPKPSGKLVQHAFDIPEGNKTFDFGGYGQADVQAKLADAQAKLGLDLSQKYDSQFIDENLKQQALADPEGVAARAKMSEMIQSQIERNPERPIADMLDAQVTESLAAAKNKGLSNPDQARLDAAVADSLASRGGSGTQADFSQPLTSGFAGEQRFSNARNNATNWLASGATPEDTAYRREQQNLSNLSAQVNGKTPQSQFRSLAGAQAGPTPMMKGGALPLLPGGVEAASASNALNNYATQQRSDAAQVNPWMMGLSSAINVAGAAGNAGYKPFKTA